VLEPDQVDLVGHRPLMESGVVVCMVVRLVQARHLEIKTRSNTDTIRARKGLSAGAYLNCCGNRANWLLI
jgi:hypothetical protein